MKKSSLIVLFFSITTLLHAQNFITTWLTTAANESITVPIKTNETFGI
jgi:hypothetical protein